MKITATSQYCLSPEETTLVIPSEVFGKFEKTLREHGNWVRQAPEHGDKWLVRVPTAEAEIVAQLCGQSLRP